MRSVVGSKPRRGRPPRAQAARLGDKILDAAAALFFTEGYGATSIDAVARRARITKRTLYDRFENKADLFRAVIHRVIERLKPPDAAHLFEGKSLEAVLHALARAVLTASLSREALALQRLMIAEAARFPELAMIMNEQGARRQAIRHIAALLDQAARDGKITCPDPHFAAEQFLFLVVGAPQRRAFGLGKPFTPAELEGWANQTVAFFLKACRA